MTNEFYRTSEVAEKFGVTPKTIKRWVATGKLKCNKTLGGHFRFRTVYIDGLTKEKN